MASNTKKTSKKPQKEPVRIPWGLISAIAFGGLAILFIYVIIFAPTEGMLSQLRATLMGLGGNLYVLFPLVFVWLCVLGACAAAGKRVSPWRLIANLLLIVCLYSIVELFVLKNVEKANDVILSWADFVVKSFRYAKGGGAIGALAAAALYPALGQWGGLIVMLIVVTILMAITGKISRIASVVKQGSHEAQQRRLVRQNDDMFQTTMLDDNVERRAPRGRARGGRPMPPPPGTAPRRRLYNERIDENAAPARRAPRPAAPRTESVRTDAPRPAAPRTETAGTDAPRAASAASAPASERTAPVRENHVRSAPAAKTSRMEFEPVDIPAAAGGILFEIDETDDIQDVPAAAEAPAEEKPVRERPVRARKTARAEDTERENEKHAEKREQISIDDLRIEPDEYETEDADSASHDEEKFVPMAKLRRDVVVEDDEIEYNYPPLDLIKPGSAVDSSEDRNADLAKAKRLEETLQSFGINTKLTGIAHGPAVTRFELQPAPGVRVSRISALADDIALNLAAIRVRIEAPIPGKAAVGVEIPNDKVETVSLRDVLESSDATQHKSRIAVGLGKDNSGRYIVADIAKMPHVLIAGQTGSGKSVCINSLIVSILYRATPEEVKLILIDPKVVELSVYNGIPHLIAPVVTDAKKAASALEWAVMEMNSRYKKFSERNVRNIKGYNSALKPGEEKMPQIVIIIDELADLMMVAPGEVEDSICRLAQLARAAGMHLVIATQRPSVNVITGIIKANIPSRIAFLVASQVDSRTIIDHSGAEKLLGNGDMLFAPAGIQKPMRVQGAWVSDEEVNNIVNYVKERHEAEYDEDVLEHINNAVIPDAEKEEASEEYDPRLPEAIEIVLEAGQASISMLQRRMRVGYARAGRLVDDMYARGIISEADGAKPRVVLITREQYERMFEDDGE